VSTNTDVSVVAFTHVDFDADSVNFAASDLTEEQKGLLLAHAENVKAAQEARAGMVRTVKALFK
ncbi:MAG: hypothetical protein GWN85_20680, partial [Gemmatimonadetes bacterium]|nr:hypothetical protein [Gemmatimonadota bacterium]NIR35042.1 hypothetical protein [Actinomycetota bacterium]NIS29092.1 hypothetical protein [Actinomycetota bacterium]NIU64498.1 hypothetical protein [Actinomycetota bacterium]NIW26291.1 hypothetical protein [Actinomycetota bacterium]